LKLAIDLHSHSGYSGGVGKISLEKVAEAMVFKGIDIFGTGDCLHPYWCSHLKNTLKEVESGIFSLPNGLNKYFILQTEIVITAPLTKISKKRKSVHIVLLYPSFQAIEKTVELFKKKGVKNTIGRPFVTAKSTKAVSDFLYELKGIDNDILIFPAHAMTPEGIFGSKNPVTYMEDFFHDFTKEIKVIETGLSADPEMLDKIPQCRTLNFISNSDCHSASLNRIGREYTCIEVEKLNYQNVKKAIENNGIVSTLEFNPQEGKFYGTGHRKGKANHEEIPYIKKDTLQNNICPVCNKPLTVGVFERVAQLSKAQKTTNKISKIRNFKHIIPLIEVIAYGYGVKTVTSKKVLNNYKKIVEITGNEVELWNLKSETIRPILENHIPENIIKTIEKVHKGNFTFSPPGYDGQYGVLTI
jgi:uncharacterized protein (TIGR00375 family)